MNSTILIAKNLPNISASLDDLFSPYHPATVKRFGRRRAILTFIDPQYANFVLHKLHQTELGGRIISVEYHRVNKDHNEIKEEDKMPPISTFVKKLYATCDGLRMDQPPPPYLKYSYPKINSDILDSISIALMSNSRFYTQVLHLMNRMNLDPPFGKRKPAECPVQENVTDIGVQTDPISFQSDVESELESDNDRKSKVKPKRKRQLPDNDHLLKKKAKKILHVSSQIKNTHNHIQKEDICNVFELEKPLVEQNITLFVDKVKLPENTVNHVVEELPLPTKSSYEPPNDLKTNRIPENQLAELAVYKNYHRGDHSNKLYIKNLSKDVTENDLRSIYERFYTPLEVKVMQQGRMKGQAFVTFANLPEDQFVIVEQALNESNGFILKNKPMVVCFGKK